MAGGRPVTITKDRLLKLIEKHGGIHSDIAKDAGLTRQAVWKRVSADPELVEACKNAKEHMLDVAESQLFKKIKQGDIQAIKLFLTTHGASRGYAKHLNISGSLDTSGSVHILELPDNGRKRNPSTDKA